MQRFVPEDHSRRFAAVHCAWPRVLLLAVMAMGALAARAAGGQNVPRTPELERRPAAKAPTPLPAPATVAISAPKGTPIEISMDRDTRVRKTGQEIRGRVEQPVYAFDRLVIPAGAEAVGRITRIGDVSAGKRMVAALDADFTPSRKVQVEFTGIILPGGQRIGISGETTAGSGQVMQFVSAGGRKGGLKARVEEKASAGEKQARRQFGAKVEEIKAPGKLHRLLRYALRESPVRPQYIDAGTVYFVELDKALNFGTEPAGRDAEKFDGGPLPPGSMVHALLETPLDSATTKKGAGVEAVLSQPLFDGAHHLILPEGSRLEGTVVEARGARRLHRNGRLRIVFHRLIPPGGPREEVDANLDSVQANKQEHVRLDSESGARSTDSKSRYLATGVSTVLALTSFRSDPDAAGGNSGNSLNRAAGGATGFRLIGIALGLAVHSQPFGMAMGAYGGGMSIYSHFVGRGHEVVFPKDTAMTLDLGSRAAAPGKRAKAREAAQGAQ